MNLIHKEATSEALNFLRIWIFGFWALIMIFEPINTISNLPTSIFQPVGMLGYYLPESIKQLLINASFLNGFRIVTIFLLMCIIFNKKMKITAVVCCLLLTLHQSMIRGFGHINHAEIGLLYAAYILAVFPFADEIFKKQASAAKLRELNLNSIPFIIILSCFCLTYTFIGIHRIVYGGLDIFTSDSLKFWIIHNSSRAGFSSWHFDGLIFQYPWVYHLLKIGFPIATIFEILAPFSLLFKGFRYAFLSVIFGFHLIIFFFMGILFWENLVLLILFFDFSKKLGFRKSVRAVNVIKENT